MNISPDAVVCFQKGFVTVSATLVYTWAVMGVLVVISWLATRNISIEEDISGWQNFMETVVGYIRKQIRDITNQEPDVFLPFLGTLFLFISVSNLLAIVPGYHPPTGSLYTTSALALCVFFAVPVFGITGQGFKPFFRHYLQPTVFMLPFNIISEFSRTLALSVRLFGNIMSGTIIAGILVSVAPLFVPVIMQALGLLIGQIQAYIFAVLAAVYISSGMRVRREQKKHPGNNNKEKTDEHY